MPTNHKMGADEKERGDWKKTPKDRKSSTGKLLNLSQTHPEKVELYAKILRD